MCLIAFALECHPRFRLILAANRDERYSRPSAAAAFWDDVPRILAGRDLAAGGTWLGVTAAGALAAVTNYREPQRERRDWRSRGRLVADYLAGDMPAGAYLEQVRLQGGEYRGFNLLVADGDGLWYWSNRGGPPERVSPGVHGLSNHLLDTPWPKVVSAREGLERLVREDDPDIEALFGLLGDRTTFPDHLLPDTGVGLERERLLSSRFIAGNDYGTRSSTVILVERTGAITFVERSYDQAHTAVGTVSHRLSPP
ncbi:MAG TPA: NRDE family protein [Desulfuromonadaceae bacterium]